MSAILSALAYAVLFAVVISALIWAHQSPLFGGWVMRAGTVSQPYSRWSTMMGLLSRRPLSNATPHLCPMPKQSGNPELRAAKSAILPIPSEVPRGPCQQATPATHRFYPKSNLTERPSA